MEPDGESRLNPGEAQLVCHYVGRLVAAGAVASDIAVIAPYAAQVRLLRKLLRNLPVEIDSVDGFQGREKEIVIVSTVRSNTIGEIGFLADTRRNERSAHPGATEIDRRRRQRHLSQRCFPSGGCWPMWKRSADIAPFGKKRALVSLSRRRDGRLQLPLQSFAVRVGIAHQSAPLLHITNRIA